MKRAVWATGLLLLAAAGGTAGLLLRAAPSAPAATPPIAPYEAEAKARLDHSPRHFEYVDLKVPGSSVPLKTFVVYPERPDKAPVVVVIMEIFGLSDWLKGACDQLAADGFIALAPDLISGQGPNGGGTESIASRSDVTRLVSALKPADVMAGLDATRTYGLKLPAANGKSAVIGFCWGGGMSFAYAAAQPTLNAAVVFYGTPPAEDQLAKIKCPVEGFYGGNDQRVTATVAGTTAAMKRLDKSYTPHIYQGAGHGFMRAHAPSDSAANQKAAAAAWPLAIQFLRDATR